MPRHDELGHAQNLQRYLRDHSTADGAPSPDIWRQGLTDFVQLDVDASIFWTPIGPAPLVIDALTPLQATQNLRLYQGKGPDSGEVTSIAIDPNGTQDKIIYVATNDGGIWKTEDGGLTWGSTMDDLLALSMGAVAIDPSSPPGARVIYAGTGNMYDGGSEFTKGVGVYRSADGGSTWSIVDRGPFGTVFAGLGITGIVVLAADTLLVATNKGLYRSADAGQNFGSNGTFDNLQPVLAGFITCLLQDAASPATTVYACVRGIGVMKSIDGGVTFPSNLFTAANGAPAAASIGTIEVAQSEQNPQVLYASVQIGPIGSGAYTGLYQSTDGGSHWALLPNIASVASGDGFGQSVYDLIVGVDPKVPVAVSPAPPAGLVYVGFQELWRSQDGGQTFGTPPCGAQQAHWDNHVLIFSPKPNRTAAAQTTAYIGTDGGICQSTDGGITWNPLNGNIGSNLFMGIDIGKGAANNGYTYGGCQDTGISGHRLGDSGTDWHAGINGDGGHVAVDPVDPKTVYGFDNASLYKTTDAGANWNRVDSLPSPSPNTRAIALELNGADPLHRVIYVGVLQTLYKSSDSGGTFNPGTLSTAANITALATTTADSNRVWVGAADGSVHYSADAGASWDQGSFQQVPGGTGPVTGIAVDPKKPARVAVCYSGLSGIHSKYRTKRIFLTTDNGATWNDVSGTDGNGPLGNLPDLPLRSVVFDTSETDSALVVASDAGVMRCKDVNVTGSTVTATWKAYGVGLPTVSCGSLAIDNSVTPPVLRVGTYGRSCFEVTRPSGAHPRLYVGPNLGFGVVPTGGTGTLALYTYNCGDAPLTINSIGLVGSAHFALNPAPAFPVPVPPGGTQAFTVTFSPSAVGEDTALLTINSNDASSPYAVSATGRGVAPGAPRLATNPISQTDFGATLASAPRSIPIQLFNVGTQKLTVSAIDLESGSSDFSLTPAPPLPFDIAPGGEVDVTITYKPTGNGPATATFKITSNDAPPIRRLTVSGTGTAVSGSLWPIILLAIGAALVIGGVVAYEELKK